MNIRFGMCAGARHNPMRFLAVFAPMLVLAITTPQARAGVIPIGIDASNFAILYEGTGGHNLSISNVIINGNVGVGGTGEVKFSGPGTISGYLDFSDAYTGQYSNSNSSNVGPSSVNYSQSVVTSALNTVNALSSSLAGLGSSLAINGVQTINESAGQLDTVNGVTYRVFKVTSYSENDGNLVTINGDGSGDPVVFNFDSTWGNVNLGGAVALSGGLTDDQILWNFTSSGKNIDLKTNYSSYPSLAFQGIILAPNDDLATDNSYLDGRFFGGDSGDMQFVSGAHVTMPTTQNVPEPSELLLLGIGLLACLLLCTRQMK